LELRIAWVGSALVFQDLQSKMDVSEELRVL
jgi:hypothetical protein